MIVIGYSGHAFVVCGILHSTGKKLTGYCDKEAKQLNPFGLTYLGPEQSEAGLKAMQQQGFFIAVGDNGIRRKIFDELSKKNMLPGNAVHASAVVDGTASVAKHGVMIAANATINPLAKIGTGAICNTGCIIEHECEVGDFAHIGPGTVLCGNVKVGEGTFVGANAVVRQGVQIGKNAVIGAGAVVVKDIPDGVMVKGVPAK